MGFDGNAGARCAASQGIETPPIAPAITTAASTQFFLFTGIPFLFYATQRCVRSAIMEPQSSMTMSCRCCVADTKARSRRIKLSRSAVQNRYGSVQRGEMREIAAMLLATGLQLAVNRCITLERFVR
jgi:hypothetical protein